MWLLSSVMSFTGYKNLLEGRDVCSGLREKRPHTSLWSLIQGNPLMEALSLYLSPGSHSHEASITSSSGVRPLQI